MAIRNKKSMTAYQPKLKKYTERPNINPPDVKSTTVLHFTFYFCDDCPLCPDSLGRRDRTMAKQANANFAEEHSKGK